MVAPKDVPTARKKGRVTEMANLFDWKAGKYNALMGKIAERLTPEKGERLLADASLIDQMVAAIGPCTANPFSLTVEETLNRLRKANEEQGWGITEEVFKHLAETAPALPEGRLSFRSLRIRFGNGQKGVEQTFEAHTARIKATFDPKFWRWGYLRPDKKHLRLLNGNETHTSTIEWCVIDLDANRKRQSITAVRGPDSLADEGLVFTWLFPEYVRTIDYKGNPAFFLAGYELNVPECGGGPWRRVPIVSRGLGAGGVRLGADWHGHDYSDYSVPFRRE